VTLPLFERFPGTASVPVAGIAHLPTPLVPFRLSGIESLERLGSLRIKRDDRTSSLYGGNKVRKLDLVLGQALAEGRTAVLTFGAYGSNHCLATAVHCRSLGIEPHVVLSPQEPGPFAPATLLAHARLGTVIHLVDGWDGRREAVFAIRELRERDGQEPLVVPMGGSNGLSTLGHVNAALEALEQGSVPDVVYVAGGTQGTSVGLAIGFASAGVGTRVESVRVTPSEVGGPDQVERIATEALHVLRSLDDGFPALSLDTLAFTLREDWFAPGYGIVTPETSAAVSAAASAGVSLETTYSGKALAALIGDAASGKLDGLDVLFWDTYNSAPMPAPGDIQSLPQVLQDYIAECRRQYPEAR
jgi:1-aminocyclopropane-1-carboxylate deaminase/D-cysteine desulfhydrase-like pyridoxal-dependent ACC family enzyme